MFAYKLAGILTILVQIDTITAQKMRFCVKSLSKVCLFDKKFVTLQFPKGVLYPFCRYSI